MAGTLITNSIAPDIGTNLYLNATQGAGNVVIGNTTTALVTFTNAGTLIVSNVVSNLVGNVVGNVIGNIANTNITGNIISSQITSVSNTQITGTITNNVNSFLVTANTLSDGTNSTSATNPIRGSAKAWVNFNGTLSTPITPRSSYNVTSITKHGTGDYTINFTNAFSDVNYTPVAMGMRDSDGNGSLNTTVRGNPTYSNSFTTTTLRILAENDSGTRVDPVYYGVVCFA
jgi:hypothetical protein